MKRFIKMACLVCTLSVSYTHLDVYKRQIVALGSNSEATRLSGVNIAKWRTLAYIISGTLAGLAGLAYASIYSTILPGGCLLYTSRCV